MPQESVPQCCRHRANSGVRVYPIAYGEVNQQELDAIAAIREGTVYQGTPEKVQLLLKDLFQTSL